MWAKWEQTIDFVFFEFHQYEWAHQFESWHSLLLTCFTVNILIKWFHSLLNYLVASVLIPYLVTVPNKTLATKYLCFPVKNIASNEASVNDNISFNTNSAGAFAEVDHWGYWKIWSVHVVQTLWRRIQQRSSFLCQYFFSEAKNLKCIWGVLTVHPKRWVSFSSAEFFSFF